MEELFEFIFAYWTSVLSITVLGSILVSIGLLSLTFQLRRSESRLRAKLLTWIFTFDLIGWSFVSISLVLCGFFVFGNGHDYQMGIRNIVGEALGVSLIVALPISHIARGRASEMLLGRLPRREHATGELAVQFDSLAEKMQVFKTRLYLADLPAPLSMAASGKRSVVILARSLLKLLTPDELSAVLAHELAHIKNGDSYLKTLAVVYRKFVPIDPILRLIEPAVHREREFFADEVAARLTGRPMQLASALIKIYESYPSNVQVSVAGLSIMGGSRGFLSRHPPLKTRIERLLRISDFMLVQ